MIGYAGRSKTVIQRTWCAGDAGVVFWPQDFPGLRHDSPLCRFSDKFVADLA